MAAAVILGFPVVGLILCGLWASVIDARQRREAAAAAAEQARQQAAAEARQRARQEQAAANKEKAQQAQEAREQAAAEKRREAEAKRAARRAQQEAERAARLEHQREMTALRERELAAAREIQLLKYEQRMKRGETISCPAQTSEAAQIAPDAAQIAPEGAQETAQDAPQAATLETFASVHAAPQDAPRPFAGQVVAFTGKLSSMTRGAAIQKVIDAGGKAYKTMPAGTTLLVVGNNPGMCKMDKADEWISQVRKITEVQFLAMFAA